MTDKPTPTDAEILDAAEDFRSQYTHGGTTFDEFDEIGFAHTVLAKWGTPAPVGVGEVAERYRNAIASACEGWTMPDGLRKHLETALWSQPTPQPTQPQAGAVPQGWKAVPVNPTPEMWKAAKSVPAPNPPYPPHYGLVWDAMLAASPTPTAEPQARPGAVGRTGCTAGTDEECTRRGCATTCPAEQQAPKAAPAQQAGEAAESVPAVEREQERIAFKDAHRHLELYEVPDAWGRPMFKHSHVEATWLGWIARASRGQASAGAAPATQPAPAPLSESEYKRGYRDGYDRRDAEVQGALV